MAEVLIKLERATNEFDLNAWARLHPVCVFEDGHAWGSAERPPKFLVLKITDMTVAAVRPYLDPDIDATDPDNPIIYAIRKWKFDIDDTRISQAIKNKIANAIQNKTILSVTRAQIVNFIKRTRV